VDKELVGWLQPEGSAQWLDVQMDAGDEWCPSGVCMGLVLFNIFISDFSSEIEFTLSKLADDTKLSGAADTPEGRDAIHKDQDKLKKWACVNLIRFNKAKCKVLHMGRGNP